MIYRAAILLAIVVITLATSTGAATTATTYEGKVVNVANRQIGIIEVDGDTEQFSVADGATITLNGKPAQLSDIEVGDVAKVSVETHGGKQVAVVIEARDRE